MITWEKKLNTFPVKSKVGSTGDQSTSNRVATLLNDSTIENLLSKNALSWCWIRKSDAFPLIPNLSHETQANRLLSNGE